MGLLCFLLDGLVGGVTIGSYITGNEETIKDNPNNSLFQHEYGHYLQSQASGPFYLQRYAFPSLCSGRIFDNGYWDYHPVEQDANSRAFKFFSTHINGYNDNKKDWDFASNPIIGYDNSLPYNDAQNQLALDYAHLKQSWHDWIMGPDIFLSGLLKNNFILNSSNRYHRKLDNMKNDGFFINDKLYYLNYY